jgi:CPA2 family monovalent cation:H+ antiporter-2
MPGAHDFLAALAVVLSVAAVTTVLFQRLHQPVVLGYLLAGVIVGPHVPISLVADVGIVQTLSELGVILLMFALGLEFSLRKLVAVGPAAGLTAFVQCGLMLWLGFVAGRLLGWGRLESLFAGAIVAISSTTIIAKAFDELGVAGRLRQLVLGVLVVEDLIAILLMATLTALAQGQGVSAAALGLTAGRLVLFLAALLVVGLLLVPRGMRYVRRLDRPETTLVAVLGLCFGVALLAHQLGYSVALGAFIAGSLVAESGEEVAVAALVHPVRDMFAAIFFVSVGMLIDPAAIVRHGGAVALLTAVVMVGQVLAVSLGAFLTGQGTRTAIQAGLSLAQIGEFSFIIAVLGASLGVGGDRLYPVAVAVSAITTLTTPWFIRASDPVAAWVDRKLPRPLQTVAALYGSWLERLRASPRRGTVATMARKVARVLVVDAVAIAALVIAAALSTEQVGGLLEGWLGVGRVVAGYGLAAAAGLASLPFLVGIVKNARRVGILVAMAALPRGPEGSLDLAAAPRRSLVVTLQLAIVILTGIPILAVTQPFLSGAPGAAVLAALVLFLGVAFWRSAANLQGHVRAGAQVIAEALARQARGDQGGSEADALAQLRKLMPGLGEPVAHRLAAECPAVGASLAALNLRGRTGATVLAIWRPEGEVMVPGAHDVLRAGDVLALAGTAEAVEAARLALSTHPAAR